MSNVNLPMTNLKDYIDNCLRDIQNLSGDNIENRRKLIIELYMKAVYKDGYRDGSNYVAEKISEIMILVRKKWLDSHPDIIRPVFAPLVTENGE